MSEQNKKFTFWEFIILILAIVIVVAIIFFLLGKKYSNPNFQTNNSNSSEESFFQTNNETDSGPIGTWTTDQPLSYSPIVTMVFIDSKSGVKYEMEKTGVMAIGFDYKVVNHDTLSMTYKDNSQEDVPFKISSDGQSLTLTFDGKPAVFEMDFQNKSNLPNKY